MGSNSSKGGCCAWDGKDSHGVQDGDFGPAKNKKRSNRTNYSNNDASYGGSYDNYSGGNHHHDHGGHDHGGHDHGGYDGGGDCGGGDGGGE